MNRNTILKDTQYLKSLKAYLIIILIVFIISFIAGYMYPIYYPDEATSSLENLTKSLTWIKELDPDLILLVIFANNALKSFIALFLGIGFGILPLLFVASNGSIIGLLVSMTITTRGLPFIAAALIPHGIIEVPMILLSAAIGLRLGHLAFSALKGKNIDITCEFKRSVAFYLQWILPLLLIAAIIESFITPRIISVIS